MHISNRHLQWYIDKIERNEPFTSVLYGDGEFMVAMRTRTGDSLQYGETITKQLEDEMWASLLDHSTDIIRGTDTCLINSNEYMGGDRDSIRVIGMGVEKLLAQFEPHSFVDGTVWELAIEQGKLGPLLKVLKDRGCVLVANQLLVSGMMPILNMSWHVTIPAANAFRVIDETESRLVDCASYSEDRPKIYVLCMGLGAIPLAMRLRRHADFHNATILDLGSVLDVFIRGSPQRGWRHDLYKNQKAYDALISANLKELA